MANRQILAHHVHVTTTTTTQRRSITFDHALATLCDELHERASGTGKLHAEITDAGIILTDSLAQRAIEKATEDFDNALTVAASLGFSIVTPAGDNASHDDLVAYHAPFLPDIADRLSKAVSNVFPDFHDLVPALVTLAGAVKLAHLKAAPDEQLDQCTLAQALTDALEATGLTLLADCEKATTETDGILVDAPFTSVDVTKSVKVPNSLETDSKPAAPEAAPDASHPEESLPPLTFRFADEPADRVDTLLEPAAAPTASVSEASPEPTAEPVNEEPAAPVEVDPVEVAPVEVAPVVLDANRPRRSMPLVNVKTPTEDSLLATLASMNVEADVYEQQDGAVVIDLLYRRAAPGLDVDSDESVTPLQELGRMNTDAHQNLVYAEAFKAEHLGKVFHVYHRWTAEIAPRVILNPEGYAATPESCVSLYQELQA